MGDGYPLRQLVAVDNDVLKMSGPAKKTLAKSAQMKSSRAKSVSATRGKSAACKDVHHPEWEDDDFDRAIAEALKSGALDDMIADALQDLRDGKTTPL